MPRKIGVTIDINYSEALKRLNEIEKKADELKKHLSSSFTLGGGGSSATIDRAYQAYSRLGTAIGHVNTAQVSSLSSMRQWVRAQDDMRGGIVKAAGATTNAAGTFQKYKVAVDAGGNTTRNFTLSVNTATGEVLQLDNGIRTVSNSFEMLSKRAAGFIAQTVGFYGVAQSMRMAFTEMKRMSDELVTYQKVTGASGAQLAQVRATSYASAKAYGQTPSDFLASVSEFARAGYKQQSADMANLATKTQLVGDITAEMASSFLLATDAGYKLHGNVKQLNSVLDAANEIDNKYATSIAKIAEGMTLTASLANQMNVPIEQLMAGLGTMTAVTQRSGSEMGRALRSVMLTVMKDTTTEVEEGITVTTDQIKSLQDALNKYASDAVKAANATGKLLNPMDALGSLAKAYQDGLLNDQSLTGILSGIGGQRYSNALIALVQNWDEVYTRMLGDISEAAGSADAEVSAMTNSWTAKLNRFKTTWTETVNDTINEDSIKNWIDLGVGVLEYTGNLENLTTVALGLTATMKTLNKVMEVGWTAKSGLGLGAGLGITAIGMIKSAYDNYYAEMQRSAEQAAQKAVAITDQVRNSALDAASVLKELRSFDSDGDGIVDNDSLETAKSLHEQIVRLIGEEAEGYETVNGNIQKMTQSLAEQIIVRNNEALAEINIIKAETLNNAKSQNLGNRLIDNLLTYDSGEEYMTHSGIRMATDSAFIPALKEFASSFSELGVYAKEHLFDSTLGLYYETPKTLEGFTALNSEVNAIISWMANNIDPNTGKAWAIEESKFFGLLESFASELGGVLQPYMETLATENRLNAVNLLSKSGFWGESFASDEEFNKRVNEIIAQAEAEGEYAKAIREEAEAFRELTVAEEQNNDAGKQNKSEKEKKAFENLTKTIESATTAKEAFDKAMSTTMADALNDYQEAFETLKKEIDEGRVNSTAAHAAYRMLLGDEAYNATGGNANKLKRMYDEASHHYDTLFKTYRNEHGDIVQGGGFLRLAEEAGVDVRRANGNYKARFTESEIDQIEKYSKLSEEVLLSALSALGQYDVHGHKDSLKEQVTPDIQATNANTYATKQNTDAINALASKIGTGEGANGNAGNGNHTAGIETELETGDAEKEIKSFVEKKRSIFIDTVIGKPVIQGKVSLKDIIEAGTPLPGYADGTEGHPGGLALVNDGAGSNAGGELIVQGGRAFIAGGGAPTLVNLERGARVFSARETKKILGSGVRSYAAGNTLLDRNPSYVLDHAGSEIKVPVIDSTWTGSGDLGFDSLDEDPPAVVYKTFSALAELMEYILNRLGTALSEQTEAIDGQIKALQEARNAADTQKELEERQEAVAEAQKDLQDAMNERTVRVLNDDGSWSWQTDARKVQQAQDSLKDAEEALKEYQDDLAFAAQVKALEAEKERLQKEYETIKKRWDEIKGGVSTPIGNLDSVLASILKGGSSAEKTGAQAVKDLLIGTLLTGGSFSGNYAEALDSLAGAAGGKPVMPGVNGLNLASLIAGSGTGATDDMIAAALSQNSGVLGTFSGGASYSVNKSINNYFNGVHIGNEMLSLPLSEVIRRLAVYDNA